MTERFNSGAGGYTCDSCNRLLWSGFDGSNKPENRRFYYTTKSEDVVSDRGNFYCSIKCSQNAGDSECE